MLPVHRWGDINFSDFTAFLWKQLMGFLTKTPTKSVNYFKIFPVNNNLMSIDVNCSKKSLTQ